MPTSDDDANAPDELEAKAAAAREASENDSAFRQEPVPETELRTFEPIGDEEPADAVDDSDPDSPNAE